MQFRSVTRSHVLQLSIAAICTLLIAGSSLRTATASPAFDLSMPPAGWKLTMGAPADVAGLSPGGTKHLKLESTGSIASPVELTYRVSIREMRNYMHLSLHGVEGDTVGEAAVSVSLYRHAGNQLQITVKSDDEAMPAVSRSARFYRDYNTPKGVAQYRWRFPHVSNIWDEPDRADIGSSYSALTPFDEKMFVLRIVMTDETRQVWIDDRLVGESPKASPKQLHTKLHLYGSATVHSFAISKPTVTDGYQPIRLDDYQTDGSARPAKAMQQFSMAGQSVPVQPISSESPDIDLSQSLYRFRMTFGSGPNAPYVNARVAWPNPLTVDPAEATFRVPYRPYRNIWLLAWIDESVQHGVPKGTVRFYRDMAGYCAPTDFEITDEAIARGDVKKTNQTTDDGKTLYLVKVPVETDTFYGFNDLAEEFIDLQITKPLQLLRSYPDPIYYGHHPGGLPSNVHVVGLTLEEDIVDYRVKPKHYGHLYEQPEAVDYTIAVTNRSDKAQNASVTLESVSYDKQEKNKATATKQIAAGATVDVPVTLKDVKKRGWHELKTTVTLGNSTRTNTLSFVVLAKNDRTYGEAANETRFGAWNLWGHYAGLYTDDPELNAPLLGALRKIGIRRIGVHSTFITEELVKRNDMIAKGPHTTISIYHRLNEKDPEAVEEMLKVEENIAKLVADGFESPAYYYGGEWGFDHRYTHAVNPRYTGEGPWQFDEKAIANLKRQMFIFEKIGRRLRKVTPNVKLVLQWGGPQNTIPFLEHDFPKDLVDYYGIDMPNFELTPELPVAVGTINYLWTVRKEAERTGWPQHKFYWCEGPFLPTNEGSLTEVQQEQNYVRYWLAALAYGTEALEAGIVPHDAGNYYGAEHYGAGVFHRVPLANPKPSVAALATATRWLCGSDFVGAIDTDVNTTYGVTFKRERDSRLIHSLWRVTGTCDVTLNVTGNGVATLIDSMDNETKLPIKDGKVIVPISPSAVWLTDCGEVTGFTSGTPTYEAKPAENSIKLANMDSKTWRVNGDTLKGYEENHAAVSRQRDEAVAIEFTNDETHGPTADVTLPEQPIDDRPLTARYTSIVPAKLITIPGKASALGVWMDGNASWGRVVYVLRDAKNETWTSIGTKDDWNCDDTMSWSYADFEGWRYVRFPLPANQPYDLARELEFTWWKHEGGDGIVDLPLRVERVIVETRNSVHQTAEMKLVKDRTYRLANLTAEYTAPADKEGSAIARHAIRRPTPKWRGPMDNPIVQMKQEHALPAPTIKGWEEPHHWNDGRRMIIRLDEQDGYKYQLYMSRYPDGRGAELLRGFYKDKDMVRSMRPGIDMYFFLVATDSKGNKTKPSAAYKLVTEDKFAEK